MSNKLSFNSGCGWTDRPGKKCYSYCPLDDPGVNRKLSFPLAKAKNETDAILISAWMELPKHWRDLIGEP